VKKRIVIFAAAALALAAVVAVLAGPVRTQIYENRKAELAAMTPEECLAFIEKQGVAVPDEFRDSPQGDFVQSVIQRVLANPDNPHPAGFISYDVTLNFVQSIRDAVNRYTGNG